MNIKTKLSIGFVVLIVLTCVVAGIGITMLAGNFERLNHVVNEEYQKIELVSDIRYEFNNMVKASTFLLVTDSEQEQNEALQEIQLSEERGNATIEEMKRLVNSEVGRQNLSAISLYMNDYSSLIDQEVSLINEGRRQEAVNLMSVEGNAVEDAFFETVFSVINVNEQEMASTLSETESQNNQTTLVLVILSAIGILTGIVIAVSITRSIVNGLKRVSDVMGDFSLGKSTLSTRIEGIKNDEISLVASSFNRMADTIGQQVEREQQISRKNEEQAWMMQKLAELTTFLQESKDLEAFAHNFIQQTVPLVEANQGVFYLNEQEDSEPLFNLTASYAYKELDGEAQTFKLGEGLIGQCGLDRKAVLLKEVPDNYVRVVSGTGEAAPTYLFIVPILFEKKVRAVFEIAAFQPFSQIEQELILKLADYSGIILDNIAGRIKMMDLLQESQTMTEELQTQSEELSAQHEELKRFNHELEEQTQALIQSEQMLQQQQEELEQANTDLEEKAIMLEEHNQMFEMKNKEVEQAKVQLEEKAVQLELTSKYKSEFLANMSHELRTPLNSLLILSKLLADNKTKNLSDKQVEFAKTINSAGCDLLDLINEILDLAKVEAGKIDVELKEIKVQEIIDFVQRNFYAIAHDKGIELNITVEKDVEEIIHTDEKRIHQILKNLLANAFKFTHAGSVGLTISRLSEETGQKGESAEEHQLALAVSDTGIGIPKDKQSIIFEAFQQADGTTSRKYGGTGLGLSISREHATALYGHIEVESEEGKGSTFTLVLPVGQKQLMQEVYEEPFMASDNRDGNLNAERSRYTSQQASHLEAGVLVETPKDTSVTLKRILIVEDNRIQRESMVELIGMNRLDLQVSAVSSGTEALQALQEENFECMVLDLGLEDMNGTELLSQVKENDSDFPTFIYTGKELTEREEKELKRFTETIIVKGVKSHDRLLEEISLFIDQVTEEETKKNKVNSATSPGLSESHENFFANKKVLIVDDDIRNVFALSNILEGYDMDILFAENGLEALAVLNENQDVDLILMDIMMPEMDGYEAITRIREKDRHKDLPIIALTAKAMKEDREKCIEVGASDYISKPIINDQLLSLMRVWLHKEGDHGV